MSQDFGRHGVQKLLLGILVGGAIVVAAATFPGLALGLKPFIMKRNQNVERMSLRAALKRLRERRLIDVVAKNGRIFLMVTEKGKKRFREFEFENMQLQLPSRWDKQWSVILFDIPEAHKAARDALRQKLNALGCLQFHKSVFVHPSPCEDEIDVVAELFHVRPFVTVVRASSLGHQEHRAYKYFAPQLPKYSL